MRRRSRELEALHRRRVGRAAAGRSRTPIPYTGEVVAHVGGRDPGRGARRPSRPPRPRSPGWAQSAPAERQRIFLEAADILESRRDEVVSWLARETGCTFGFGMFQMGFVPGLLPPGGGARRTRRSARSSRPTIRGRWRMGIRQAGRGRRRDRAVERRADPVGALDRGAARARQHRRAEAVGVVAVRRRAALGRDLRRGRAARRRAEHRHPRAPARRGADRRRARARTRPSAGSTSPGSTATGRRLAEAAGRNLKRVVLELGGSNPLSCSPTPTSTTPSTRPPSAPTCTRGRSACRRAGSSSSARSPRSSRARLAEKAEGLKAGDPKEHGHDHRAARSPQRRARAREAPGRRGGCRRARRCSRAGRSRGPATRRRSCRDVPEDTELARLETFGPVAAIEVVDSADEAVERANATELRPLVGDHHHRTPTAASSSPSGSRPASSTSTTSPSATSRRCRSAA